MLTRSEVEREYQKELNRYRSQQVLINALLEVKGDIGQSDPDIAESINVTCLPNDLKLDQDDVDTLFGTKLSSKPIAAIQKAKVMKLLTNKISTKYDQVINFVREIKLEKKFNIFEIENVRKQIELLLTEYNQKLEQLANYKEKVCELESLAVNLKASSEQRKTLEVYRLEVKRKIIENERFKRVLLHKVCNQIPGNTEALMKLKEFVESMSK